MQQLRPAFVLLATLCACTSLGGSAPPLPVPDLSQADAGAGSNHWRLELRNEAPLWAISGADATHLMAVGSDSMVMVREGSAWTVESVPTPRVLLHGVWMRSTTEAYVIGSDPVEFQRLAGAWRSVPTGTTSLRAIWGRDYAGAPERWAGGDSQGVLFRYRTSWGNTPVPIETVFAAWGNAQVLYFAGGVTQGQVVRLLANSLMPAADLVTGFSKSLRGLWGFGENGIVAVGTSGELVTTFQGTEHSAQIIAPGTPLYGIWGSAPDNLWAVGLQTLLHYDGKAWAPQTTDFDRDGVTLTGIWGADADNIWAVGQDSVGRGLIVRY